MEQRLKPLGLSKECWDTLLSLLKLRGPLETVREEFLKRTSSVAVRDALDFISTTIELTRELGAKCGVEVLVGEHLSNGLLF